MMVPAIATRYSDFSCRLTFMIERGVVLAVDVLEGMLGSMRYIPGTAY